MFYSRFVTVSRSSPWQAFNRQSRELREVREGSRVQPQTVQDLRRKWRRESHWIARLVRSFPINPFLTKKIFAALNMKDWPVDKPSIWQPIALKCLNSFRQWERMDNETPMYSIPALEGNQLSFCGGSRVRAKGSFNLSLTAILWFLSYFLILIFKLSNVYIFSGLKNDSMSECFRLRHTVRGHFFPCRFIKIVPIQVSSISKSFFKLVKLRKSSM